MSKNPLVSVILPVYNAAPYIDASIQSILNQTYSEFELIIIDDCSTDNSLEIIKSYKDSRIKVLRNEYNRAIAYSLNKGIRAATGQYIARMDADDQAMPERLQRQIQFLESNTQVDICGSAIQILGGRSIWSVKESHELIRAAMIFDCPFYHPTVVFRAQTFIDAGLRYDEEKGRQKVEDYALWIEATKFLKAANIPTPLLKYRLSQNQPPEIIRVNACNQLRRQVLSQVGVAFTDKDLELHYSLCGKISMPPTPSCVEDVGRWFHKIIQANEVSLAFEPSALREIIEEKLWKVYIHAQRLRVHSAWSIYRATGFSLPKNISMTEKFVYSFKGAILSSL